MAQLDQAKFVCSACGKQYRWKPQLAGKKAKCKCGNLMAVPVEAPAEQPEYSLYEDTATKSRRAPTAAPAEAQGYRCPSCGMTLEPGTTLCMGCGFDMKEGRKVAAGAPHAAALTPGMPYAIPRRKGLTPDAPEVEKPTSVAKDVLLPIALIVGGLILCFVEAMYAGDVRTPRSFGEVLPGTLITVFLSLGLVTGACFAASAMTGMVFADPVWITILKLCAVALAPGAVGAMLDQAVGGINGNIIGAFASVGLYWLLFYILFRVDIQDTVVCVMLIWIIRAGVLYAKWRAEGLNSWI